jgi:hypothetical protein
MRVILFIKLSTILLILMIDDISTSGLYYKHITIVNDHFRVVRMTLQVVASPMIVILTTLEVLFTLLENFYSTAITHDDRNIFIE